MSNCSPEPWRNTALFLFLVIVAMFASGQDEPKEPAKEVLDSMTTKKLRIVDDKGKVRIFLGFAPDTGLPYIIMRDANGKPRLLVDQETNGNSSISLIDADERVRGRFEQLESGKVSIRIGNESKKATLIVGEDAQGLPEIVLSDAAGKSRLAARIFKDGQVSMEMADNKEQVRWIQMVNGEGLPLGVSFDANLKQRIAIGIAADKRAGLSVFANGKKGPSLSITSNPDAGAELNLYGADARLRRTLGIDTQDMLSSFEPVE